MAALTMATIGLFMSDFFYRPLTWAHSLFLLSLFVYLSFRYDPSLFPHPFLIVCKPVPPTGFARMSTIETLWKTTTKKDHGIVRCAGFAMPLLKKIGKL
jgi:hypothetical protein